jgi:hypothetical protein
MGMVTRRQLANLLASLAVAAILAGLAFGLPALDAALPSARPVSSAEPYPVGGGVTVVPPTGAVLDVTGTRPGDDTGSVLFRLGPVRYSIVVQPFDGTLDAAATSLRQRITASSGYQVTGAQLMVATHSGITGVQGGYTAPGQGGRYIVFVVDHRTIEVTVSGADLDLGGRLPAIDGSTRTLRYTSPS